MDATSLDIALKVVVAFALLCVSFFAAFSAASGALRRDRRLEARLAGGGLFDADAAPGAQAGLLERLGSHLSLPGPEEISRLRAKLARAGFYAPGAVKAYYAARVLSIVVPVFALLLASPWLFAAIGPGQGRAVAGVALILGTLGPDRVVAWRAARRERRCREGFPDMLDLLTASIEAGLSMDAALIRVAQEIGGRHPDLKIDLDLMNLELRAGRTRAEALKSFADRTALEEAQALAVMLKQAEEMGSSLGHALRTFSEDMREKRMMRAQEKAAKLAAKLTVPLMLFIFPTLIVILLVPAAIRVAENFTNVG